MARFPLQFQSTDQKGKIIVGATITVTLTGTSTVATSYEESTGGVAIPNGILTTDTEGRVKYWIDEADYTPLQFFRVRLTGASFKTSITDDVIVFPATSADSAASSAAASAAAALVSENNAAADEALTNADAAATAADKIATNADVVLTGLDVISTNADVVLTGLDVVSTAADAVATGNDATATAADVVSTNADVVSTGNDATATGNDVTSTNADVVSTNADVVLTTAQVGAVALKFTFSSTTTMADPGTGTVRLNNATIGSVTAIAFDDLSADTGNPDVSALLLSLDDSTNTAHLGTITIKKQGAPATFITYSITGATTDNAGWSQFAVTYVDSNGTLTNADTLYFSFARTGNVGATPSTEGTAILSTGEGAGTKFLREDGDGTSSWQAVTITPEGTAVKSTGETGGVKFLREDGDGTCSWQAAATGETIQAWARFNGTGVLSVGDSFNVSSVADNSAGNYTVNWDTDFATVDYCVIGAIGKIDTNADPNSGMSMGKTDVLPLVGSITIYVGTPSGGNADAPVVSILAVGAQ